MALRKEYKNYIFDLYGTLIDICADEYKPSLWSLMAKAYNVYGCVWTGPKLKDVFFSMDREEREITSEAIGTEYPEIRLERVFARLLFETDKYHETFLTIGGYPVDELRSRYENEREEVLKLTAESEWCAFMANLFRIHSRSYIRLYKNTLNTFKQLKAAGKKVYLLSNAQKIFTNPELEASGLLPYFDAVYISSDYDMKKPEKRFMEILLKHEALNRDESVMVGNEVKSDAAVAAACGMDSIILNTAHDKISDIKKQIKQLSETTGIPKGYTPGIIISGDIAEII